MAVLRILEGVRENVVEVELSNGTVPIGTVVELDILAELKCNCLNVATVDSCKRNTQMKGCREKVSKRKRRVGKLTGTATDHYLLIDQDEASAGSMPLTPNLTRPS